jgi:hypothetical protein
MRELADALVAAKNRGLKLKTLSVACNTLYNEGIKHMGRILQSQVGASRLYG